MCDDAAMATSNDLIKIGLHPSRISKWCQDGYLHPDIAKPGSGQSRSFPDGEVKVAAIMVRLVNAGLRVKMAERIARSGLERCEIAPGIVIEVLDRPADGRRPMRRN